MAGQGWQSRRRSRARHDTARSTPTGWTIGAAPGAETVIAVLGPAALPVALARLHGAGFGHLVRVLDPARGDIGVSLRRAGITADIGLDTFDPDASVVLVQATGRSAVVGDLLLTAGAREVRVLVNPERRDAGEAADLAAGEVGGADSDVAAGDLIIPTDLDGSETGAGASR